MARWPETQSLLPSQRWVPVVVGVMFCATGLCVWVMLPLILASQPQPSPHASLVCAVLGISLIAIGISAFVWAASGSRHKPFRHATNDVLPEVPREPVLADGTMFFGSPRHRLVQDDGAWRFEPDPERARRQRRIILWLGLPLALVMEVVTVTGLLPADLGSWRWALHLLIALAVAGVMAFSHLLMTWMTTAMERQIPTLTIPDGGGDLVFARPGPSPLMLKLAKRFRSTVPPPVMADDTVIIPRSAVLAVQLCACRGVIASGRGRSTQEGIGLNLVWRTETAIRRVTLITVSTGQQLAQQAVALADHLAVPLLHHATPEHWATERLRAKHRAPLTSGGFSSD